MEIGELQVKDKGVVTRVVTSGHKLPKQVMLCSSEMPVLKLMKAQLETKNRGMLQ